MLKKNAQNNFVNSPPPKKKKYNKMKFKQKMLK